MQKLPVTSCRVVFVVVVVVICRSVLLSYGGTSLSFIFLCKRKQTMSVMTHSGGEVVNVPSEVPREKLSI